MTTTRHTLIEENNTSSSAMGLGPGSANRNTDCLVVGFNEGNFPAYVRTVRATGEKSPAFVDLRMSYVLRESKPYRLLDLLSVVRGDLSDELPMHSNMNFPSPAVEVLASRLEAAGLSTECVNLFQRERKRMENILASTEFRLIAITTTLYVHPDPIREVVRFVRGCDPDTKIVVGGPFVNNMYLTMDSADFKEMASYLGADYLIVNREGEATLVDLVQALKAGTDLRAINNLSYRTDDRAWRINLVLPESNGLVDHPTNFRLMRTTHPSRYASIRTAKSCPFSCAFCAFPARSGDYTYSDVQDVANQLDRLADLGVDTVSFIDDTFNVPRRRFHAILRMMIDRRYPFKWNCFYRSDHGNEETISLMQKAGCEGVFLGVESGSDRILELMNKTARRRHFMSAIPRLRDAGISTYASLIVGFPGETEQTVEETRSLIEQAQPDYYRAQLWYCDPSTPIWERRESFSLSGYGFTWQHSTMDSMTASRLVETFFPVIGESTWLPQWGFEQWSIFYLRRLGFTDVEINSLISNFNSIISDQMRTGNVDTRDSRAFAKFEQVARRRREAEPNLAV